MSEQVPAPAPTVSARRRQVGHDSRVQIETPPPSRLNKSFNDPVYHWLRKLTEPFPVPIPRTVEHAPAENVAAVKLDSDIPLLCFRRQSHSQSNHPSCRNVTGARYTHAQKLIGLTVPDRFAPVLGSRSPPLHEMQIPRWVGNHHVGTPRAQDIGKADQLKPQARILNRPL